MAEPLNTQIPARFEVGDRITARHLNAIAAAIPSQVRSTLPGILHVGNSLIIEPRERVEYRPWFLAKITGNTAIAANAQWKYAWSEMLLKGDDLGVKTLERSGTTTTDYALNLVELNNTTATANAGDGILADKDSSAVDYPDGYKRRPIGAVGAADTHVIDVPVFMFVTVDENDAIKYVFSQVNGHHGTCAAP